MYRSKRFARRAERPVNLDTFVAEDHSLGLKAMNGPADPSPTLVMQAGRIIEMDGTPEEQFDTIDRYIATHSIDRTIAVEAMATSSLKLARMLVDINVPRQDLLKLLGGCTPAKLCEIVGHLNVVEMMMAMQKMRARRTPGNQAHVTNWRENPVLMAADAAEAALRGFDELETTCRVARMAPFNALALLVGSQTGRGGVLTQCAVEEALNLRLGLKGLTTYAETLSVYGTDEALRDGDDTPWSKGFLASAYASRGIKIRFTSGTGAETLMGYEHGRSMLYLEARCLLLAKGAGAQGVQNGAISCVALTGALPEGVRAILAENLIAASIGLEVASGNDAMSSHSDMRKTAKLMLQFLPGTDFITSGYSSMPRRDNMFGGGNFDAEDLDDWMVIQRDMRVNAGIHPVTENEVLMVRRRAGEAMRAVFESFGFPSITEHEIEAAVEAYASDDMPERDLVADIKAAEDFLAGPSTALDVARALLDGGFDDIAANILSMQRVRISGDYLQPAAVLDANFGVKSAFSDRNDYEGPGTGYRLSGEEWERLRRIPQEQSAARLVPTPRRASQEPWLTEKGSATTGRDNEVVLGVGPAFGESLDNTLCGLNHREVISAIAEGVASRGLQLRVVRIGDSADLGIIGTRAASISGSGIGIGLQSKGTTVIQRKGLAPLNNLELFSQAPLLSRDAYRQIGVNAACFARGEPPMPVPVRVDNMARLRLIVHAMLMHKREIAAIDPSRPLQALEISP
ncbi:MAG: propanediol/glycerol family dehydratase large subunit [Alphaproteobacteria bacterium]|nr:propanediol/glycerol family dehydratase large subunit [Alphaproteobacteria bacterium]